MKNALLFFILLIGSCTADTASESGATTFEVIQVPAENGTYTVSPLIPSDNKVEKGTVLSIKAQPNPGYSLESVYHTAQGGMWGVSHFESFTPEFEIRIDTNAWIGANFIETAFIDNIEVHQDVLYAQPGKKALKYDVFTPKEAELLPCIVIIHGGGWSSNNEDVMRGLARELTKGEQYVVASIDYRWINQLDGDPSPNHMHQLIEDVFGAIAHIQEHAAGYGVDPTRIAVTGDSAGGHLSAAAAVLCPYIGDGGFGETEGVYEFRPTYLPDNKTVDQVRDEVLQAIKAAAPSYGPFNAADFQMFVEQTDPAYWEAVSPFFHVPDVKQRAVPHFIVRGTEDPVVPHEVVQPYVEALKAAGQRVEYIQVEGAGHAFFDWKPDAVTRATFLEYGVPYAAEMKAFFDGVFYAE